MTRSIAIAISTLIAASVVCAIDEVHRRRWLRDVARRAFPDDLRERREEST